MWRAERVEARWRFWTPGWEYFWALSSYGAFGGRSWSRRGAYRALARGQAEILAGETG